jgi:hypothetical protein
MDEEHFIDIYGSGTTPDVDPEDKFYDGIINSGYVVWSEFIAQYYAVKMIDAQSRKFKDIAGYVKSLLSETTFTDMESSKGAFSMACACWLNCSDIEKSLAALKKPGTFIPENEPYGTETQNALFRCMDCLYEQMQNGKPWKISEGFIYELGFRFMMFRAVNSLFFGIIAQ